MAEPDAPSSPDASKAGLEASAVPVESPKHRATRVPRQRRRVTTQAVPGTDPTPANEPARHAVDENDDRLKRDKPPHWG